MEGSLDTERPLRAGAVPAEIAECVAQRSDLWIFAYGSRMGDPGFAYAEAQPALLRGYHRSFCVYSPRHRGTPERPGIVLGLDRGGACKGIAYRVPAGDVAAALHYLWDREMARGTYRLKQVQVDIPTGKVKARTFAVDRKQVGYAGRMSPRATARLILHGIGGPRAFPPEIPNT